MANWHIAYCMQDVHSIVLLYCKPVTGRGSIRSASLKTDWMVRFLFLQLDAAKIWKNAVTADHWTNTEPSSHITDNNT